MKPTINHEDFEMAEGIEVLSSEDDYQSVSNYPTHSFLGAKNSIITPELVIKFNFWHFCMTWSLAAILIGIFMILMIELDYMVDPGSPHDGFFGKYWLTILQLIIYLSLASVLTRYFADIRYLIFKRDKVILQSKYLGRRVYLRKDLKFHLVEFSWLNKRYHLEVELPDESIPEYKRIMMLETAASRKTIDGVLSVFLSLIKGDPQPYIAAQKRIYQPIAEGKSRNIFMRIDNFCNHVHVWFLNYKINNLLFWLVHGPRQNLIDKERDRDQ